MLESYIEEKVRKYAMQNGVLCYKFLSPQNRGVPDRMFLTQGKVLFIELKRPKGEVRALQDYTKKEWGAVGIDINQCYTVDSAVELIDRYRLSPMTKMLVD